MLTVTALAAEKLKETIQAKTTDPEVGIRLVPSSSRPNQLDMTLDKEKEGDQVVESEGVKILLYSSELAQLLEGMVIDCQETSQGVHFTISKLAPDT
jgi:Fe-S cluster assembly iron-binding protein IscA